MMNDNRLQCSRCGIFDGLSEDARTCVDIRYSLGLYVGKFCGRCWEESGYRKEDSSGFDPMDAGESYEEI